MLYTCANPVLEITAVGRFSWKKRQLCVEPRPFCALAFRLKGSGNLYCGGKSYRIAQGDVLYMPQGLAYRCEYTDTDLLLFHFVTPKNDPEPEIYTPNHPEEFERQFQKAIRLWEEKKPGYTGKCISILYRILGLLAENDAEANLPAHFLRATQLLSSRYCRSDLRIGDICKEAVISQTVFRQLFKKHYGKTPVDYLTELRLENARNLIAGGSSVETAALESGFSDAKYFCRVVRQHWGCTPRQLKLYGN